MSLLRRPHLRRFCRSLTAAGLAVALALVLSPLAGGRGLATTVAGGVVQAQTTGTISGVVRAAPTDVPLPYAVVTIPALGLERFSGADGRYVLTGVPAGAHRVIVRRIGFVPLTLDATVTAGTVTTLDARLVQIPVRLSQLTVRPTEPCRTPGLPDARTNPEIAALVGLVRENADTYRTLAQQHPYAYAQLRALGMLRNDSVTVNSITTDRIDGIREARYKPGKVVSTERGQSVMQLPTILDLTDTAFLANHCFHYRGTSAHDAETWVALEVRAADRLKAPDVHGVFYLDSASAQLRRMELELSRVDRLPSSLRQIMAVRVRTTFLDIAPGLSVVDDVCAISWLKTRDRSPDALRAQRTPVELQQVRAFAFLATAPPDIPERRDFPSPPWATGAGKPVDARACRDLPP